MIRRRIQPSSACSMRAWPCSWSMATTIWASRPCSRPRVRRRVPSTITSRTRRTSRSRSSTSTCRACMRASTPASETQGRPPLERVRRFFEMTQQNYRKEGYMGCLLGGLGQELSGVSEVFRRKIEECFSEIAERIAVCLEEARQARRHPGRFRSAAHGEPAGGLLGGRRAAQPAAAECRAADRDARLLLRCRSRPPGWPRTEQGGARQRGRRHAGPSSGEERPRSDHGVLAALGAGESRPGQAGASGATPTSAAGSSSPTWPPISSAICGAKLQVRSEGFRALPARGGPAHGPAAEPRGAVARRRDQPLDGGPVALCAGAVGHRRPAGALVLQPHQDPSRPSSSTSTTPASAPS